MDVKKEIGSNREQNTCFNVLLKCVWVVNENDAKFILTSVLNKVTKAATNDIDEWMWSYEMNQTYFQAWCLQMSKWRRLWELLHWLNFQLMWKRRIPMLIVRSTVWLENCHLQIDPLHLRSCETFTCALICASCRLMFTPLSSSKPVI